MMPDDTGHILCEEEILPSSGFVGSVMDAVRREAATPPPIPFPWKRALPGLVAAAPVLILVLVMAGVQLVRVVTMPPVPATSPLALLPIIEPLRIFGANWIVLALLLTLGSVKFSMRLTGVRA